MSEFYYYMTNLQGDVIKILDYDKNVVANYSYDAWGRVIAVTDANGNAIYRYAHLQQSSFVSEGDIVLAGQRIGTVGNTGNSSGAHLHFEVILWDDRQNPQDYLPPLS